MLHTSPNGAIKYIELAFTSKQPVFVWGSPGVGKSDAARKAASNLKVEIVDVRASQMDPVDLRGIPYVDQVTQQTTWAQPDFLPTSGEGILFLDEMNSAPPSVQAALYQLILDRKLGNYTLPDGWVCMGAGNLDSDRGVTHRMPTPLRNRFSCHMQVDVSNDDWHQWGIANNIAPEILAYIKYRPENLYRFDPKSDEKAFPTPRSWSFVNAWWNATNGSIDEAMPLVQGAIGEAVAIDFKTHLTLYSKLPSIDDIMAGKAVTFDATDPAICYSLATAVGHHANKKNIKHATEFLINEMSAEYGVMGMKYAIEKTPELYMEKAVMDWAKKNKHLFVR